MKIKHLKKSVCLLIGVFLMLLLLESTAAAEMITFDDISGVPGNSNPSVPLGFIPDQYNGFTWTGFNVMKYETFSGSPYNNTYSFPSQDQVITNNGSEFVTISSSTPFDLIQASFAGFGRDDDRAIHTATAIEVFAYRDGAQTGYYSNDIPYDFFAGAAFFQMPGFSNIDTLKITSSGALIDIPNGSALGIWLMDDFEFFREEGDGIAPVPEPSTVMLLAIGILGLAKTGRKRF